MARDFGQTRYATFADLTGYCYGVASTFYTGALQTVTYTLDGSSQYAAVRRDAARPRFLRLVPGVNNFQITEAGMGELEIKDETRAHELPKHIITSFRPPSDQTP